ncbi:hypothetical protein MKW98_007526 [Papaver atlanticum]|uniref:Uncharacterized protein n=1 Tax=Papaver atlanticum TaxID=357466 RepID=A0AAD4XCZ0_9MAGN|nr:hypothetical protein MKW98_007526 [Papaver atlanticum]
MCTALRFGAKNIEAGVGCGVGFGHGFGAGMIGCKPIMEVRGCKIIHLNTFHVSYLGMQFQRVCGAWDGERI